MADDVSDDPPRAIRKFNTCFNALDRHVAEGRADQAALIFDSPVTGFKRTYTYRELLDETAPLRASSTA